MRFYAYILIAFFAAVFPAGAQSDDPETCRASSDLEAGIEACNRVISSGQYSPRDVARAYIDRGQKHYVAKRYDEAIRDASRAIDNSNGLSNVDLAIAYSNRGNGYFVKNEVEQAIDNYSLAIRTNPNFAAPYTARGILRERRGETEAALADFKQALRAPRGDFGDDDWAKETARQRIDQLTNR